MRTIITFIQMQILSSMIVGPIAACLVPFNGILLGIVVAVGLLGALAVKQPSIGRSRFSGLKKSDFHPNGKIATLSIALPETIN